MTGLRGPRTDRRETTSQLVVEIAGVSVAATVIRSSRRRRTISISVEGDSVKVRAPMASTSAQLADLLGRRAGWIQARLGVAPNAREPRVLASGDVVPYSGRLLTLQVVVRQVRRAAAALDGDLLRVTVPNSTPFLEHPELVRRTLTGWYRTRANEALEPIVRHWATVAGLTPARVLVRDQRRRWGSCAPDGTIRLNWRLILTEPHLAEYVVVHELAHLRHRHHQAAFWQEVEWLIPEYLERRRQLRKAGHELLGVL